MPKIEWDKNGERRFETGVDHGVLYPRNATGEYTGGVPWNGLTTVTDSPSGAESNKQYADNIVYLNLVSAEEYGFTIEAFTYPDEFAKCDGSASPAEGVSVGQQSRETFGFSWRTLVGDDIKGQDAGYKLHLAWGCLAAPSEKAYGTVNDSPEALNFSWEVSTTPTPVDLVVDGKQLKPTASITIDSTKVEATKLAELETLLYGDATGTAKLPSPKEVIELFS